MIKNIFANSGKFWNWLVVSSVDPSSVALSVQGFFSMAAVQTLFGFLPYIGIHPTFTLAMLSAGIVSTIYTLATIVTSVVTLYGLVRKAIVTMHNLVPAPAPIIIKPVTTVPPAPAQTVIPSATTPSGQQ